MQVCAAESTQPSSTNIVLYFCFCLALVTEWLFSSWAQTTQHPRAPKPIRMVVSSDHSTLRLRTSSSPQKLAAVSGMQLTCFSLCIVMFSFVVVATKCVKGTIDFGSLPNQRGNFLNTMTTVGYYCTAPYRGSKVMGVHCWFVDRAASIQRFFSRFSEAFGDILAHR